MIDWAATLAHAGVRAATAAKWAPLFTQHVQPDQFSAGLEDLQDFTGQILHESMRLERLEESLWYSTAARLCQVWPSRFKTEFDALPYLHQPQRLANFVYGGRMGNVGPNDGWTYRGRGLVMVTGLANYRDIEAVTGIPLVSQPDTLAEPETALIVSKAWWERRIPDSAVGDIPRITRLVQGGQEGLADREQLTHLIKDATA